MITVRSSFFESTRAVMYNVVIELLLFLGSLIRRSLILYGRGKGDTLMSKEDVSVIGCLIGKIYISIIFNQNKLNATVITQQEKVLAEKVKM